MLNIDYSITPEGLGAQLDKMFDLAAQKITSIENSWDPSRGTPVFTIRGEYTSRGWTEWTQGFQFGCAILQFDATDDKKFLDLGRDRTIEHMAPHISHVGVDLPNQPNVHGLEETSRGCAVKVSLQLAPQAVHGCL